MRDMVLYGAQVQPEEIDRAVQYLVKNFGPTVPPAGTGAPAVTLPDGPGKDLVATRCVMCHTLDRVVSLKRDKNEWPGVVTNMSSRGAVGTPEELQSISKYLVDHFSAN